ncbi:MAG: UvrD-helicase domain-containing protein [Prevotella sp.]|nr:UvrD-helicase domain-containing protein [Prevotella sp.]MCM1074207.1 UvrD-helicase domain-containing protein [Ruminococcus sp.]
MLLQRASAGSGKTFKLAKTYIRLFISTREDGSDFYRLLSPGEVRDAHTHILGITFTNKATNEMKQRIVEKLAALAAPVPVEGMEPPEYKFPDYLLDFTGESQLADPLEDVIYVSKGIPARRHEITETCQAALSSLLNNYSNFNISTIDSFFQGVLRTLAYELRINDTYHVELNDDYLAQAGVDETLSAVKDTSPADSLRADMANYMKNWLGTVMRRRLEQGDTWDAFSRKSQTGIYSELVAMASKMSREDFKKHLAGMQEYFATPERFMNFYNGVLRASGQVNRLHRKMKEAATAFMRDTNPGSWQKGVASVISNILDSPPFGRVKINKKIECNRTGAEQGKNAPFIDGRPERSNPAAQQLFTAVCDAFFEWDAQRMYWSALLSRLHYLGALYYISESMDAFLNENNLIPLSATNEILNKIIGKDEVPFIYERTGVSLQHFLLDEFQDTSRLQWDNLKSLLAQSDAYGHENLIIGDAKQSIYRFRNADPELINSQVKKDFPRTCVLPDSLPADSEQRRAVNTNWRSSKHIVAFNNTLFNAMAPLLDEEESSGQKIFSSLYGNVVQNIKHMDKAGYVQINFGDPDSFNKLGPLIDSLRSRGYNMSNIAILTDTQTDGQQAIRAIIAHNESKIKEAQQSDEKYAPIEFISEESLLVGESAAVKVILAVMSLISNDFVVPGSTHDPNNPDPDSPLHMRPHELAKLEANFNIGLSMGTITGFSDLDTLNQTITSEQVEALYRRMGATTLPTLVENIASAFLTDKLLTNQVAYISAFQDIVLEYCDAYTSDLCSFLNWWKENGSKYSIAAPEGVDALQILTVHKSKGLEFDVVIMPKADWNLAPAKEHKEILWVSHIPEGLTESEIADVPDYLPITPNGATMNNPESPFYKEYHKYFNEGRMDQLNKTYVAFTRAAKELYVTAPQGGKDSQKVGKYMRTALNRIISDSTNNNPNLMDLSELTIDGDVYTYGSIDAVVPNKEKDEKESDNVIVIDRYAPSRPLTSADAHFTLKDNN